MVAKFTRIRIQMSLSLFSKSCTLGFRRDRVQSRRDSFRWFAMAMRTTPRATFRLGEQWKRKSRRKLFHAILRVTRTNSPFIRAIVRTHAPRISLWMDRFASDKCHVPMILCALHNFSWYSLFPFFSLKYCIYIYLYIGQVIFPSCSKKNSWNIS